MINKALLKQISSYKQKKFRDGDQVFVVEGEKMIKELVASDFEVVCICANEEWINNNTSIAKNHQIYQASPTELERISNLKTPDKVLAVVKQKSISLSFNQKESEDYKNRLTLVLDDIKNPGNLGTIIRLASWFGIKDIICSKESVECYNPKVVQASMGAIFHTNINYTDIYSILQAVPKDFNVYGAVLNGGNNIYKEKLDNRGMIVIGNESLGISPKILRTINKPITIPTFSSQREVESLNASMATAIILSEFKRREI